MSERTDERTTERGGEVDLDELLEEGGADAGVGDSVGADVEGDPLAGEDDLGVDVEALTGDPDATRSAASDPGETTADGGPGLFARLRPSGVPNPLAVLPSGRSVLLTFAVVLLSVVLASSVPLLGFVGAPVGVFAGAFVLGLVSGTSRYVEFALAGALVSGLGAFQGTLFRIAVFSDVGFAPVFALAGGVGLVIAVLGHYFGRDLRNGLTASVE
jgi:hypothetical protein